MSRVQLTIVQNCAKEKDEAVRRWREGGGSFQVALSQDLTPAKSWAKHSLVSEHSHRFATWSRKLHKANSDGGSDVPRHDGPGRGGGHPHQLPLQLPSHVQPPHHGPPDDQQPPSRAYKVRFNWIKFSKSLIKMMSQTQLNSMQFLQFDRAGSWEICWSRQRGLGG